MTTTFALTAFQELPAVVLEKERLQAEHRANRSATLRSVPAGSAFAASGREYSEDERNALPGTRLDLALPVSEFLERTFDMQLNVGGMTFPDGSGGHESSKRHVLLHTADDDGIERATVYGEYTAQCLGVEVNSGSHSTFSFLISAFCEGDTRLAARIAAHFLDTDDLDGMIDLLEGQPTVEDMRAALPIRLAPEPTWMPDQVADIAVEEVPVVVSKEAVAVDNASKPDLTVVASVASAAVPVVGTVVEPALKRVPTVLDGLVSGKTVRLQVGNPMDGEFVQVGGPQTGYYVAKTVTGADGEPRVIDLPITNWVAFRSRMTQQLKLKITGEPRPIGDATYTVTIITASGFTTQVHDLTAAESVDCRKILEKANAGIALPIKLDDRSRINNMLLTLGWHDAQEKAVEFTSTGLHRQADGKHVLLLPAGSMTAAGISHAFTVTSPAGSEEGSLKPAQEATGFDHVAEGAELRQAAECIPSFLATVPSRPSAVIAILGGLAAAFLPLSRKTSVLVLGPSGSGKSWVLSCGQSFFSGVGVTGSDFSMSFQNASKVGAEVALGWANSTPFMADDFRFEGEPGADKAMRAAVGAVVQASYGSDGETKGTQGRGLKAANTASTVTFISGEGAPPSGPAIINRYVAIEFQPGDIAISPMHHSPIDDFRNRFGNTGVARSFFASFAQWMVGRLDEAGNIIAFRAENDRLKGEWASSRGQSRASENSATLAVGWLRMHEWAAEQGISDMLPSMQVISEALTSLVTTNNESVAEVAYGRQITHEIGDYLAGGGGYLEDHRKLRPSGDATCCGWIYDDEFKSWGTKNRDLMGVLSADRKHVLIFPKFMKTIRERLSITMSPSQFGLVLQEYLAPGTKANQEAPSFMGIGFRARGFIFQAETLGLSMPEEAPAVQTLPVAQARQANVPDDDDY